MENWAPKGPVRGVLFDMDGLVLDRFDRLCSGHPVSNGKPAPDIYRYGAASLGLEPG